ncbi:ABC transporter ATP-binding protein [Oceanibium sediminis]|uniref:ABC transporter ATP-binding protein n=1 Tax=Oceanibium sediminis TaxID=2026339 RepID=UPI000DD30857|nr:ABC transporter ATP-binding protein [Oceanibium sediminis]
MTQKLLEIDNLEVHFTTRRGVVRAVRGVSLSVGKGETLGLVGESGSGKSVTSQAAMGLVHIPGEIVGGDIRWKGQSLLGPEGHPLSRRIRGREMAMIFQDAMTSLNPLFTCGQQITEVLRYHRKMNKAQAQARALELFELVGISAPLERLNQYPFEMSGGMRQRGMIAMALACEPELLIADEPTTALDVTIQAQILELLQDLQKRLDLSIIMITHDLGVVAGLCDRVAVMYGGQIVEEASADEIFSHPAHPYTMGLLRSTPRIDGKDDRMVSIAGSPPDLLQAQQGCAFASRCPSRKAECSRDVQLKEMASRQVACRFPFSGPWSRDFKERTDHIGTR